MHTGRGRQCRHFTETIRRSSCAAICPRWASAGDRRPAQGHPRGAGGPDHGHGQGRGRADRIRAQAPVRSAGGVRDRGYDHRRRCGGCGVRGEVFAGKRGAHRDGYALLVLRLGDAGHGPPAPEAIWGFNGTERPGAVYLASALAGHNQKGLPAFSLYSHDVQDAGDGSIPEDVQEKLLRFVRAGPCGGDDARQELPRHGRHVHGASRAPS